MRLPIGPHNQSGSFADDRSGNAWFGSWLSRVRRRIDRGLLGFKNWYCFLKPLCGRGGRCGRRTEPIGVGVNTDDSRPLSAFSAEFNLDTPLTEEWRHSIQPV